MRSAFIFILLSCSCLASDRLSVQMLEDPEKEITHLMDSLSEKCESNDFEGFLGHFTKSGKVSAKKKNKKLFSEHIFSMRVVSVNLISSDEKVATARVEYVCDIDILPAKKITSNVSLKKESDEWKIDSEKILFCLNMENPMETEFDFGGVRVNIVPNDGLPADIGRHNLGDCAGGNCGVKQPQNNMGPNDGLPADIGRHNLGACAGGNCGIRQPQNNLNLDPLLPADVSQRPTIKCVNGRCPVR